VNEFRLYAHDLLYILKHMYSPELIKSVQVSLSKQNEEKIQYISLVSKFLKRLISLFNSLLDIKDWVDGHILILMSFDDLKKKLRLDEFSVPDILDYKTQTTNVWKFLHYMSILVQINNDSKQCEDFEFIYLTFYVALLCGICSQNYRKKPRVELLLKNSGDYVNLIFELHNMVNGGPRINQTPVTISKEYFLKLYGLELNVVNIKQKKDFLMTSSKEIVNLNMYTENKNVINDVVIYKHFRQNNDVVNVEDNTEIQNNNVEDNTKILNDNVEDNTKIQNDNVEDNTELQNDNHLNSPEKQEIVNNGTILQSPEKLHRVNSPEKQEVVNNGTILQSPEKLHRVNSPEKQEIVNNGNILQSPEKLHRVNSPEKQEVVNNGTILQSPEKQEVINDSIILQSPEKLHCVNSPEKQEVVNNGTILQSSEKQEVINDSIILQSPEKSPEKHELTNNDIILQSPEKQEVVNNGTNLRTREKRKAIKTDTILRTFEKSDTEKQSLIDNLMTSELNSPDIVRLEQNSHVIITPGNETFINNECIIDIPKLVNTTQPNSNDLILDVDSDFIKTRAPKRKYNKRKNQTVKTKKEKVED
jgi:hypothetical protein